MLGRALVLGVSILGSCWLAGGCGSAPEALKAPPQTVAAQAAPPGKPVTLPGGQQYAMSDLPSSGELQRRPQMNATAAQAYAAGLEAFKNGDLLGAQTQFARAGEGDPRAAYQAYHSLGVVRERMGNPGGALGAYLKALGIVPAYEPSIVSYAVVLARSGRTTEAESFLRGKQAKMSKSAAILAALAEVKSIAGDSGEAQRLAQEALKRNPDYRPAMETLARDHYRNRRLDLALYALKGILDGYGQDNPPRDKDNAQARLLRALVYREQGLRAAAISEFKRALELRPDLVEARVDLAAYMLESGNAIEAAPLLEGALRYDRNNVVAHLNLGDAYRLLGKTAEAKRELEWVVSKDPTLAEAHYNLGLLYLFSENVPGVPPKMAIDEAIREFSRYKDKKSRSAQGGSPDDTDELISRAKNKKAVLEAQESAKAAPPASPAPSAAAMPARSAASASVGVMPSGASGARPTQPAAPPAGSTPVGKLPPTTGKLPPTTGKLPPATEGGRR